MGLSLVVFSILWYQLKIHEGEPTIEDDNTLLLFVNLKLTREYNVYGMLSRFYAIIGKIEINIYKKEINELLGFHI